MKQLIALALVASLAACGGSPEEAEPVPVETQAAAPEPIVPSLPPPDEATFASVYAEACPDAAPVSTSLCRSKGFGESGFSCQYGLGDDEYRRNTAELIPGDGQWTLSDPENTCSA